MNFIARHRSKILTWGAVAAPILAGVVSGGVFTAPVIIAAVGVLLAKLAASPLNNDAERQADVEDRLERIKNRSNEGP